MTFATYHLISKDLSSAMFYCVVFLLLEILRLNSDVLAQGIQSEIYACIEHQIEYDFSACRHFENSVTVNSSPYCNNRNEGPFNPAKKRAVIGEEKDTSNPDETSACSCALCDSWNFWVRFVSPAGNEMITSCPGENHCGTHYPVWLDGSLPPANSNSSVNRTVCQHKSGDCCAQSWNVTVKNCGDFNVYYFHGGFNYFSSDGNCSAICIGNGTRCPEGQKSLTGFTPGCTDQFPNITTKPVVQWGVNTTTMNDMILKQLQFECHLNIDNPYGADLMHNVSWHFAGTEVLREVIPHDELPSLLMADVWTNRGLRLNSEVNCSIVPFLASSKIPGEKLQSDSFFAGFKVLEPNDTSSGLQIPEGETVNIKLRTTVPVICPKEFTNGTMPPCELPIQVKTPQTPKFNTCNGTSYMGSNVAVSSCRLGVTGVHDPHNEIWQQDVEFTVNAPTNNLFGDQTSFIQIMVSETVSDIFPLWSGLNILSSNTRNIDGDSQLRNKRCTSNNDPHMKTFDGKRYECQYPGEYVLYKSRIFPMQVNGFFAACSPGSNSNPYCNCGVAVKSYGSVFVIDKCSTTPRIEMIGCDTLALQIESKNDGDYYIIHLPTGLRVHVWLQSWYPTLPGFMNIAIDPSPLDFNNCEGLCGVLNCDTADDFFGSDGILHPDATSYAIGPIDFINSWQVSTADSLFTNVIPGPPIGPQVLCQCDKNGNSVCSEQMQGCIADDDLVTQQEFQQCQRKKRDTHHDFVTDVTLPFNPGPKQTPQDIPFSNGWNETAARAFCEDFIDQSAAATACGVVAPDTLQGTKSGAIEDCITDIKSTGNTDWTLAHLETIKSQCDTEIKKDPTLFADDGTGTISVQSPAAKEIVEKACPNECTSPTRGTCDNGVCSCTSPFSGVDCSFDESQPPTASGIPQQGLCDSSVRPCRKTFVTGLFRKRDGTICRCERFEIDENGSTPTGMTTDTPAGFQNIGKVLCDTCDSAAGRRKRTTAMISPQLMMISVGYTSATLSTALPLIVYDSRCQICSTEPLFCRAKDNICVIEGMCYQAGERNPANMNQICDPTVDNSTWINVGDANVPGQARHTCFAFINEQNEHMIEFTYAPFDVSTADGFAQAFVSGAVAGSACVDDDNSPDVDGIAFRLNLNAGNSVKDCGIQNDGSNQVSVEIILSKSAIILQQSDLKFKIYCEFNQTITQNVVAQNTSGTPVGQIIAVVGEPDEVNSNPVTENVVMYITEGGSPSATIGQCTFGQFISMRIDLTLSSSARGVRAIYCSSKPDGSSTTQLTLLKSRCGVNSFAGSIPTNRGFEKRFVDPTVYSIVSPSFKCFRFHGVYTLQFQCVISFCQFDGKNWCDLDQCQNEPPIPDPAHLGRRKRAASDSTEMIDVTITVGDQTIPIRSKQDQGNTTAPAERKVKNCLQTLEFILPVSVLGTLLVLSMICSVIIYIRASANRNQKV